MLPIEARRTRRNGRDGGRPGLAAVERLEGRALLAVSALQISQPDLTVSGFGAPVASWGGPYAVTVDVQNLGTTTTIEPLAIAPGAASTADAGPTEITVFLTAGNGPRSPRVAIGTIDVPAIQQNSLVRLSANFDRLPDRPPGFPDAGGTVFLSFSLDPENEVRDLDRTNNAFVMSQGIRIVPLLPDLAVTGLDVPPLMQPGDVILPSVQVANFGGADASTQVPAEALLVASPDPGFRRGVVVLDRYRIENLEGLSEVPQRSPALGDVNLVRPANVQVLQNRPVKLPTFAPNFYLGVIVDPDARVPEIRDFGRRFLIHGLGAGTFPQQVKRVGPPIRGLPPAGILSEPSSALTNPFPFPSFPVNSSTTGALPTGATTGDSTSAP